MKLEVPTILNVQAEVGFIFNHENGIIERAIEISELNEVLKSYGRKADFRLTFSLGYRKILYTFFDENGIDTDGIINAIAVAIDSQSYNLQTILSTMNADYNPIVNVNITEDIVNSSSISSKQMIDKISTSKNISEITHVNTSTINSGKQKETNTENIVDKKGTYTEMKNQTENLGKVEKAINEITTNGAQINSNTITETHAPYNTNTYSPRNKNETSDSIGERIDQIESTEQTNPTANTITTSTNVNEHTNNITRSGTINKDSFIDTKEDSYKQNPYNENDETLARSNMDNQNRNDSRNRKLQGLQGKSPQELLLLQRQLANVDIVKCLCEIVINTIGCGFIGAW